MHPNPHPFISTLHPYIVPIAVRDHSSEAQEQKGRQQTNNSVEFFFLLGMEKFSGAGEKGKNAYTHLQHVRVFVYSLFLISIHMYPFYVSLFFPHTAYIPQQNLSSNIKITRWLHSVFQVNDYNK